MLRPEVVVVEEARGEKSKLKKRKPSKEESV